MTDPFITLIIFILAFVAAISLIIYAFTRYLWSPSPMITEKCEVIGKKMVPAHCSALKEIFAGTSECMVPDTFYVVLKISGKDKTITYEVEKNMFEQVAIGYLYTITYQEIRISDSPVNAALSKY